MITASLEIVLPGAYCFIEQARYSFPPSLNGELNVNGAKAVYGIT